MVARLTPDQKVARKCFDLNVCKVGWGSNGSKDCTEQSGVSRLDIIAFTSLLDGYVNLGYLKPARHIFGSLRYRDVVAWTAMIVGYLQNGLNNDALELFRLMVREGPKPNHFTLAGMLSVSSGLTSLSHDKQIHASAIRTAQASLVSVNNSLITMYARAGSINCARKVFNQIHWFKDIVSWTSLLNMVLEKKPLSILKSCWQPELSLTI
ncbi:hypothetical protein V6N11_023417 [Hibiscus sabdariffa]|uniref:Pentatricopeptide repeat-containing protein n=1 Tax=Hibiscus sabdariffa TaxID=183260 RepID=A0ABR2TMD5_9ROSI